eukprot:sb/3476067/
MSSSKGRLFICCPGSQQQNVSRAEDVKHSVLESFCQFIWFSTILSLSFLLVSRTTFAFESPDVTRLMSASQPAFGSPFQLPLPVLHRANILVMPYFSPRSLVESRPRVLVPDPWLEFLLF